MADNMNVNDYRDINQGTTVSQQKTFNHTQISLLTRSMLYAGIGFVLIALIGFGIGYGLYNHVSYNTLNQSITLLWVFSIILILVSMVLSMVMNTKLYTRQGNVSNGLIWTTWIIYIVAEGLGFGLLFLAFIINFATENSSTKGIFYLIFVFAAGGLAFIIASFIGKAISDKAAISLAKFTAILSIGFMIVMFVFLITALVVAIVSSQFNNDVLFLIIIGLSTVLFLLYLVLDMKSIAKTQQFLNVDNAALTSKLGMIFGFRLLVDLVGLVWNIAILVLRFAR